jgi:hypothetical protein
MKRFPKYDPKKDLVLKAQRKAHRPDWDLVISAILKSAKIALLTVACATALPPPTGALPYALQ